MSSVLNAPTPTRQLSILERERRGRSSLSCRAWQESCLWLKTAPMGAGSPGVALGTHGLLQTLPSQLRSCLERVRGEEYPLRGLAYYFFLLLFCILHVDWRPLETAFSGASLSFCMPGRPGSAGLYPSVTAVDGALAAPWWRWS